MNDQKNGSANSDMAAEPGPESKKVASLEKVDALGAEAPKDVQQQVEEHEAAQSKKFDTFAGVFTPSLLTILGVIMFLRTGWVVGNAGLGGAFVIILMSFAITGATGLSMSSFVTNIRVGPGGAFSMISQSLGLEVGGAVGVPLYVSQALGGCDVYFWFPRRVFMGRKCLGPPCRSSNRY